MDDSATGPAAADSARRHDIRRAATAEAGKHTVLIRTQRSGRILSALMMPWFRLRPPRGYGVLTPTDYGECAVHRRGLPSRAKIQELHRYWFDTGNPLVIELHP
ncbi:hypothetical protein [Nocardia vulneris]|uniref:Inorganic diphosphatase n=1 Tax=Nocardia vulneris TaxID=1141657 RepID=A0ABR4Z488_9NOCA|nr:hypothetical protein [Nocardia vulneris]KIA60116.1 hypothetical protein FG87_38970 [Nocardia vulneris]